MIIMSINKSRYIFIPVISFYRWNALSQISLIPFSHEYLLYRSLTNTSYTVLSHYLSYRSLSLLSIHNHFLNLNQTHINKNIKTWEHSYSGARIKVEQIIVNIKNQQFGFHFESPFSLNDIFITLLFIQFNIALETRWI